jgi:hypothetical protein
MPSFGVCGLNTAQSSYSFSYAPLSTSDPLSDGTGTAGIVTDDLAQPASPTSATLFSYAPESSGNVISSAVMTAPEISFEPLSTTYTAVDSTWAARIYKDAWVTTVTVLKKVNC